MKRRIYMFIDIHTHAFRKPPVGINPQKPNEHIATVEDLIEMFDTYEIEKGAVLPMVSSEVYLTQANEDILDMAEKYPDRIIPFCNIDPRYGSNSSETPLDMILQYYKNKGCKGIGEVMPLLEFSDPRVQNLFRCAEKVGLPVTFEGACQKNTGFGMYLDQGLPQLEQTLMSYTGLKIVGHGSVFWSEISRLETPGERAYFYTVDGRQVGRCPESPIKEEGVVPVLLRRYPNLYGDLSDATAYNALARDEEYGPKFLEEFQDKLMFGTDYFFPGCPVKLPSLLKRWREEGKISETVFNKIARENAIRIYGL